MRKVLVAILLLAGCASDEPVALGNGEYIITASQGMTEMSVSDVQRRAVVSAAKVCGGRGVQPISTAAQPQQGLNYANFTMRFRCL